MRRANASKSGICDLMSKIMYSTRLSPLFLDRQPQNLDIQFFTSYSLTNTMGVSSITTAGKLHLIFRTSEQFLPSPSYFPKDFGPLLELLYPAPVSLRHWVWGWHPCVIHNQESRQWSKNVECKKNETTRIKDHHCWNKKTFVCLFFQRWWSYFISVISFFVQSEDVNPMGSL